MEANGGGSSEIVRELKELKLQKAEIEHRISALEAKLQETAAVERCDAVSNGYSVPAEIEHGLEHGMSPDQIYRYSRQLLLPSFGVEGTLLPNTQNATLITLKVSVLNCLSGVISLATDDWSWKMKTLCWVSFVSLWLRWFH